MIDKSSIHDNAARFPRQKVMGYLVVASILLSILGCHHDDDPVYLDVSFITSPPGATVKIDGRQLSGQTPISPLEHRFVTAPAEKDGPWPVHTVTIEKPDFETRTFKVSKVNTLQIPKRKPIILERLRKVVTFNISAMVEDPSTGGVTFFPVRITIDNEDKGMTGSSSHPVTCVFQRASSKHSWPTFNLRLADPLNRYKPVSHTLTYGGETNLAMRMDAATHVSVVTFEPQVKITAAGARFLVEGNATIAAIDITESNSPIRGLRKVTDYPRQDTLGSPDRIKTINSFTLTSSGKNLVYSETAQSNGAYFANLILKSASEPGGRTTNLTEGTRHFYTDPFVGPDGSNLLLYQSNLSDINKPDIWKHQLTPSDALSGRATRVTQDLWFNFDPNYLKEDGELYYSSVEPAFPQAKPQLSSIKFDGREAAKLNVTGRTPASSIRGRIFFSRRDAQTGKAQIFSVDADGRQEAPLLTPVQFRSANCHSPVVSRDGSQVLFVCDAQEGGGGAEPANDNIYLVNADGTNPVQLTNNSSRDYSPAWSPQNQSAAFFISTRGGAVNIWTFEIIE